MARRHGAGASLPGHGIGHVLGLMPYVVSAFASWGCASLAGLGCSGAVAGNWLGAAGREQQPAGLVTTADGAHVSCCQSVAVQHL